MSDCDRLLALLRTGPKTHLELYGKCGVVHSRAAELRARGHEIDVSRDTAPDGKPLYVYSLKARNGSPTAAQRSNTVSVREAREAKGWKLRELARQAKVSPGLLSLLEQGRYVPTPDESLRLARALGRPLVVRARPKIRVAA